MRMVRSLSRCLTSVAHEKLDEHRPSYDWCAVQMAVTEFVPLGVISNIAPATPRLARPEDHQAATPPRKLRTDSEDQQPPTPRFFSAAAPVA